MLLLLSCSNPFPPPGFVPGREEGEPPAVQVSGQVLSGGRVRGADPGRHAEALLPADEGEHPGRRGVLSARDGRAARLLRRPRQVQRLQQGPAQAGLPALRAAAAAEVSRPYARTQL